VDIVSVTDCMTKEVISIAPDLSVENALELMGAHSIRRLPVLNATGRLVGIVTREDARVAVETARCEDPDDPKLPKVREVMSDYVYTVAATDSIAHAAMMMVNHDVGALPVLDDGKVVGIVTESDLFEYLARHLGPDEAD
jgi:acetoin utilization protein AcuB